jgi:hypothetical protein
MQTVRRFQIEQIALVVADTPAAKALLSKLGLNDWVVDTVVAKGEVFGDTDENTANLHFNYQAGNGGDHHADKPLELEVLEYTKGPNWMELNESARNSVSHLGMHVTAAELQEYRLFFHEQEIAVAQEVVTQSHTNAHIADSRRYNYVIFDTRDLIGVDLKFIVRLNVDGTPL